MKYNTAGHASTTVRKGVAGRMILLGGPDPVRGPSVADACSTRCQFDFYVSSPISCVL